MAGSEILALGYTGFHAPSLAEWESFGPRFLGLQLAEATRHALAFRMDDRKQRIFLHTEADHRPFLGWEVADGGALDALATRLEAAGIAVARLPAAFAAQRHVADGLSFADPAGNRLEAFHGAEIASEAFRPGRSISGFMTGPLGVGHIVLNTTDIEADRHFYQDVLGFRLSDYVARPFRAMFFHVNGRHHSLALIESARSNIHHLMIELYNLDDVGQGYDLALREEGRIATTLGRHSNDFMTSFYSNTPSGFMLETGWGGRTIDPANWEPYEMRDGPSLWGHERNWVTPEQRAEAARLRLTAAANGVRAPVQVVDGNYRLSKGVCAWWDAATTSKDTAP